MLSTTFKDELARLSLQEKLEVFEAIRASVAPLPEDALSELSPGQKKELFRRAKQAANHPDSGDSWNEVKQRILGS